MELGNKKSRPEGQLCASSGRRHCLGLHLYRIANRNITPRWM